MEGHAAAVSDAPTGPAGNTAAANWQRAKAATPLSQESEAAQRFVNLTKQAQHWTRDLNKGRGLHSSTFRLNLSAFCGIGVHLGFVWEVPRRCLGVLGGVQGVFCVRNGSS